jgi:hypothetical protein
MLPGRVYYVGLDDQIVMQEFSGIGIVGMDAADFCSCQINLIDILSLKPGVNRNLIAKIEFRAIRNYRLYTLILQTTTNC